jgi:hypothetical protein
MSNVKQKIDEILETKDFQTLDSLESAIALVSGLDNEDDRDWYLGKLSLSLSQLGEWARASSLARSIQHNMARADALLSIAELLFTANEREKVVELLVMVESAALEIEGERYWKWQKAEILGKLGRFYSQLAEHNNAIRVWHMAIDTAHIGQNGDDPQELWDCSGVLSEITTYLAEAGLRELAQETAKSIRIDYKREGALKRLAQMAGNG